MHTAPPSELRLLCLLQGRPVVRKVAVVTPSSLTQNWADEARKWLGEERMRVMVLSPGLEGKQQASATAVVTVQAQLVHAAIFIHLYLLSPLPNSCVH